MKVLVKTFHLNGNTKGFSFKDLNVRTAFVARGEERCVTRVRVRVRVSK